MNPLEITLLILLVTIIAFVSGKVPFSVISTGIILALILTGIKTPAEAFGGFINTNVVMFVAMFVIGAGLTKTPLIDKAQKLFLIGKQYEAERAEHGCTRDDVQRTNGQFSRSSQNGNSGESIKTCERIAKENGVSKNTVLRASKYMKGVEIAEELMPGLKQSILSGQTKVSKADMHRLAKAAYNDRAQTLQDILHPELKVEPTPDADGVIRVPGKAPVMPFRKFESVYDSDAYPEDVRYEYVALEELTTRFRISFSYQLEQMPDNAQRHVILEIIHKHKDYLTSLEAALADVKEQTA